MIPDISLRFFTDDQYVLDKVFYSNCYGIDKIPEDVCVVDFGAHIGCFSASCIFKGATKVFAFEPFYLNFLSLQKNSEFFSDKIACRNLGVSTEIQQIKLKYPELKENHYIYSYLQQTDSLPGDFCTLVTLDDIVKNVQEEKIFLLKLSTCGGELEILEDSCKNSNVLDCVENVCGETVDYDKASLANIIESMKAKGFTDSWFSDTNDGGLVFIFSKTKASDYFNIYAQNSNNEKIFFQNPIK